ncbi:MAG: hypothetical protein US25_C0032G0004 [Candidatus Moranbacteria bacterium GW2011_GWE1_36_7]|nr:MAG: hypothetical protein UR99_C0022G0006 [Candidatus Moranbacteria bacterium GW2011_GWD2_36_12]KKQ06311.1 MAG: hypothetical protein US16_C0019G0007 [Candidatus Moranbacteria bacterium GW2011_GWE2_36_40]KKQ13971.1 MAG: hypothetical protein US25_C0032G0004 [Candidatus Moranbacteria bacterium GW2011_GWE1_36_7]
MSHFTTVGDPELATSIPVVAHYHGEPQKKIEEVWKILEEIGVKELSEVGFESTINVDAANNTAPYALIMPDMTRGMETSSKMTIVMVKLKEIGLNVRLIENFLTKK